MRDAFELSKSRYTAALQCARRLWLQDRAPEGATPPDASRAHVLEVGRRVGEHARRVFPGGVLVEERFDDAVERTRALLDDTAPPTLFEAAFTHEGVRIRVDALEPLGAGRFGLREAKSATSVREEHLDDVVLQLWVLRGCGLDVASVEVVHLDPEYVRGAGGVDWMRLFKRTDVTRDAEFLLSDVAGRVAAARATLRAPDEPAVEPSPHCRRPRLCEFWDHCTRERPDDWIYRVPGIREPEFQALLAQGVQRIRDIPAEFPLKPRQARARRAHLGSGEARAPELAARLAGAGPPACYLDFETLVPAVPRYAGTRPYQRIPFQWSLHRLDLHGRLSHAEFLAATEGDPRAAFADALVAELERDTLPILVYSAYEGEVLAELERDLPDRAPALARARERLVDVLELVREGVYSTAFRGSFSLKRVVAALVPGFGYGDLERVRDGAGAALALDRLVDGELPPDERERLRAALRAYCRRDTEALVAVHRALRERARQPSAIA